MLRLRFLLRPSTLGCRAYRASLMDEMPYEDQDDFAKEREVIKNVYEESETTAGRSQSDILDFQNEHSITIKGNAPKPVLTIDEVKMPSSLKGEFAREGITKPTPIQSLCWPLAMSGQDMIGIAQTGSGKTLGYLLPSAVHIAKQPESKLKGPTTLVLAPTRELVQQIAQVSARWLGSTMRIRYAGVYGGASRLPQIDALRRGAALCIATPGRLLDLLESRETSLANSSFLVLDEADRMLDMGFEPQIRDIISRMRKDRQTVMFSATWPNEVRDLAADFMMPDAVRINIGSTELCASRNIQQEVRFVASDFEKNQQLHDIVLQNPTEKILVFAATKRRVSNLARDLYRAGVRCVESHGDLSQARRERSLELFKGTSNVMIATDVAARGLDVRDIKKVINYDFPNTIEDYIHRIGRTGRSNAEGNSITFFTPENRNNAKELIEVLKQAEQPVPKDLIQYSHEASGPAMRFRQPFQKKPFNRFDKASNWRWAAKRG